MKFFSWKSLLVYGGALGVVLVLFGVTTRYGEAHLRAPDEIDGVYDLSAEALPGCLAQQSWHLLLAQSGVYLTGSLLPSQADEQAREAAQQRPALTGQWDNQQLWLQGTLPARYGCPEPLKIQGVMTTKTAKPRQMTGTLNLGVAGSGVPFQAELQAPQKL